LCGRFDKLMVGLNHDYATIHFANPDGETTIRRAKALLDTYQKQGCYWMAGRFHY